MTPEWTRVHQGGHHDVWCNGTEHERTEGGYCWADVPFEMKRRRVRFKCDCEYWNNMKETLDASKV
jgi:hypothetical protein